MPWIVYETVNKTNGKKYIGVHLQSGHDFDGYLGSGNVLQRAIAKYGRDAFERRTLFEFSSEAEAYAKEKELVGVDWVESTATYNLKHGGMGGGGFSMPTESKEKIREYRTGRPHSQETRDKISRGVSLAWGSFDEEKLNGIREARRQKALGRKASEETRRKMSDSMKEFWRRRQGGSDAT